MPADQDSSYIIDTGEALWAELKEKGGVDLDHYDAQLRDELIELLGLDQQPSFEEQLKQKSISAEELLRAFFRVISPYAEMMRDLLEMFEKAGARTGEDNILVNFDFDGQEDGLNFDLRNFREWTTVWSLTTRTTDFRLWNSQLLWSLASIFRSDDIREPNQIQNQLAVKWLEEYEEKKTWPQIDLPPPRVPDSNLQIQIDEIWGVLRIFLDLVRQYGPSRDDLKTRENDVERENNESDEPDGISARELWYIDSDGWAGAFVSSVYRFAEKATERETEVRDKLDQILNQVPNESRTITKRVASLMELFKLPVWERRHEVYAAWVGTRIVHAFREAETVVHQANGRILFRFTGTHLATIELPRTPKLLLWAELRSPLQNPIGASRKRNIQPDYTVAYAPVTDPLTSIMAIECKQYLKSSNKTFANALDDYARGKENATVILVNYGPVSDGTISQVSDDVRSRTRAIGYFRPGREDAFQEFNQIVSDSIGRLRSDHDQIPVNISRIRQQSQISLSWGAHPKDLDLHLWYRNEEGDESHVCHSSKGDMNGIPFAALDRDCTSGHGPEIVRFSKLLQGTYYCAVHKYSDDGTLADSNAKVDMRLDGIELSFGPPPRINTLKDSERTPGNVHVKPVLDGTQYSFVVPSGGEGRWWYLFSYNASKKSINVMNSIHEEPPVDFNG